MHLLQTSTTDIDCGPLSLSHIYRGKSIVLELVSIRARFKENTSLGGRLLDTAIIANHCKH